MFQRRDGKKHLLILCIILPLLPNHFFLSPSNVRCPPLKFFLKYHVVFVVRSLFFQPSLAFARVRNSFCFLRFYYCIRGFILLSTSPIFVSLSRLHVYRNSVSFVSWVGSKIWICVVDRQKQFNFSFHGSIVLFFNSVRI